MEAGGFSLEFPAISLDETILPLMTMLFRNIVSMDGVESIRNNLLYEIVIHTACDKTTRITIMGACSMDLKTVIVLNSPR